MKKIIISLFVIFSCLFLLHSVSKARPIGSFSLVSFVSYSDVIAVGTVKAIETVSGEETKKYVVLNVEKYLKDPRTEAYRNKAKVIIIYNESESGCESVSAAPGECKNGFIIGKKYLVILSAVSKAWADRFPGEAVYLVYPNFCRGNFPLYGNLVIDCMQAFKNAKHKIISLDDATAEIKEILKK